MKHHISPWLPALMAVFALLVIVTLVFARGGTAGKNQPSDGSPGFDEIQIQKISEQLKNEQLSPEARSSLQEKLEIASRMATQQALSRPDPSAGALPKVPPPLPAEALANGSPDVIEGIFSGSQGLVRPSQATVTNMWQGERDGKLYQVFAGAGFDDPTQGLLIVSVQQPDKPYGARAEYLAPARSGALRILEVTGMQIAVVTENGANLTFDLALKQFHP